MPHILEACSFKHQTATVQFNNPQTQSACIIIKQFSEQHN